MTNQDLVPKRRGVLVALAAFLVVIAVMASLLVCLNFLGESSRSWEDGQWSPMQTVNFGWPSPVEFQGKLFMFYSAVTKDTYDYKDDMIEPGEYVLHDVFYRTFDGNNFSDTVALSNPVDEVSTEGGCFVYGGKLYALLSEKWIVNYTSYEWVSRVRLEWLDGSVWREAPSPFGNQSETYYGLRMLVVGDKAWLVWVQPWSDVFSFKTFDGKIWSETRNATFPTLAPNGQSFTVLDGKLWAVWENQTIRQGPPVFHTHEDIYVGSFDGENWSDVAWLNMPDDDATNLGPFMVAFQGSRFVFWESEYFSPSALAMRRIGADGVLGAFEAVSPVGQYGSGSAGACVYEEKLYVFRNSGYPQRGLVRSFNGTTWSSVYKLSDMAIENMFVFAGKLWVYASQGSRDGDTTMIRSFTVTR